MGTLNGLQIAPSSPKISNLFFADDSILFTQASSHICSIILELLHMSSQQVNFCFNTPLSMQVLVRQHFGIQSEASHFKYLDLPSFISRKKIQVF